LGARLDFSLDDLDDLYLAADRLLQAALDAEKLTSLRVECLLDGATLRVATGSYHTTALRDQVGVTPGGCIDLCTLLRRLVDEVTVEEDGDCYSVVIVKHRTEPQT
jgi:hypothetical protein